MATKKQDAEAVRAERAARRQQLDDRAEWIAKWIDVDDEAVMIDGQYGISLTPDQIDKLIDRIRSMGFQDAIDLLRASGDEANSVIGKAIYTAAAQFLEEAK